MTPVVPSFRTGNPVIDLMFAPLTAMLSAQASMAASRDQRQEPKQEPEHGPHEEIGEGVEIVPVVKEQFRVRKEQVRSKKAYRIVASVAEVPVQETVTLRKEKVVIERRPINRTTHHGVQPRVVEVHELEEIPVIEKSLLQTEEILVRKAVTSREETYVDTVREMRVKIEEGAEEESARDSSARGQVVALAHAAGNKPRLNAKERRKMRRHATVA